MLNICCFSRASVFLCQFSGLNSNLYDCLAGIIYSVALWGAAEQRLTKGASRSLCPPVLAHHDPGQLRIHKCHGGMGPFYKSFLGWYKLTEPPLRPTEFHQKYTESLHPPPPLPPQVGCGYFCLCNGRCCLWGLVFTWIKVIRNCGPL